MRAALLVSLLFLTSACAAIVSGSTQPITLDTPHHPCSRCSLESEVGNWDVACTPHQVVVDRSTTPLDIKCFNAQTGAQGIMLVESGIESWALGNIVFGGLIGAVVDASTGSAYVYPADISIPMGGAQSVAPVAAPAGTLQLAPSVQPAPSIAPAAAPSAEQRSGVRIPKAAFPQGMFLPTEPY